MFFLYIKSPGIQNKELNQISAFEGFHTSPSEYQQSFDGERWDGTIKRMKLSGVTPDENRYLSREKDNMYSLQKKTDILNDRVQSTKMPKIAKEIKNSPTSCYSISQDHWKLPSGVIGYWGSFNMIINAMKLIHSPD